MKEGGAGEQRSRGRAASRPEDGARAWLARAGAESRVGPGARLAGGQTGQPLWRAGWRVLTEPKVTTRGYTSGKSEDDNLNSHAHPDAQSSAVYNSQDTGANCLLTDERVKKMWRVHTHNGILLSHTHTQRMKRKWTWRTLC